jgi:hypothetical protein
VGATLDGAVDVGATLDGAVDVGATLDGGVDVGASSGRTDPDAERRRLAPSDVGLPLLGPLLRLTKSGGVERPGGREDVALGVGGAELRGVNGALAGSLAWGADGAGLNGVGGCEDNGSARRMSGDTEREKGGGALLTNDDVDVGGGAVGTSEEDVVACWPEL